MKKLLVFFTMLCAMCSLLGAQTFYEGQGGRNLGGIRVSEIEPMGLSDDEAELLPLIQMTFINDFTRYAGMTVPDLEDMAFSTRYTLTGTITKTAGLYYLQFAIRDNSTGITKTTYGPIQCTLEDLRTLKGIKTASEELITGMGITLTTAGRTALRTTATNEAEAMNALARSMAAGATTFERAYYTYQARQLDPSLAEAARRLAAYQTEIYKAPEINFAMPDIRTPEIRAPEFEAPEIRMVATGNIGEDARRQLEQYNAQREVSRVRQESGNKAMQNLQDAFLAQFITQSEAVKKQQTDLLEQRDSLLAQQRTLLERQRQMIAQLRETENSYDTFFIEYPPFEIIYDPEVKQIGSANLEKGTIDLQFAITSIGTQAMQVIPLMLADFEKGLGTITQGLRDINAEFDKIQPLFVQVEMAGRNALTQLVNDYSAQMTRVQTAENNYAAQLADLDKALNTTGYAQLGRDYAVQPDTGYAQRLAIEYAVQSMAYNAAGDKTMGDTWTLTKWNKDETRAFAVEAWLENDTGKTIGRATVNLTNQILATNYTQPLSASAFGVFRDVQVNDITDGLKVFLQRVNGKDVTIAANADYIKISPLETDGYTKDGWDMADYDKDGYHRNGYDRDGYARDGYNRDGYARDGYNRDGYDRGGYDRDDRNRIGQTRKEVEEAAEKARVAAENAAKKAARQRQTEIMWGRGYVGIPIGVAVNIPAGGLFEFGLEIGGKWLNLDAGFGWGVGSLTVTDVMLKNKFGTSNFTDLHIFSQRIGATFPIKFEKRRLNIGGGIKWLNITVQKYNPETNKRGKTKTLDTLVTPYVEARLDTAFAEGLLIGFIGYRCEFPSEDKFKTYFRTSSSLRHTIFAGLFLRVGGYLNR